MKTALIAAVVSAAVAAASAAAASIIVTSKSVKSGTNSTVVSVLGDRDGFGYGLTEGSTRTGGLFDNREPDDPPFTDVWPVPATQSPRLSAFSYEHQFEAPQAMSLAGASFRWFAVGIQDGDTQVAGGDADIRLFVDGVQVPGAFDMIDQFDLSGEIAGSVTIDVPAGLLRLFADGSVVVSVETHALGSYEGLDGFAIDFSQLTVVFEAQTLLRCVVPNVKGKTLARARAALKVRRCTAGRVSYAFHRAIKKGRVIAQSKRPGTRHPRGTKVNLTVSRGRRRT